MRRGFANAGLRAGAGAVALLLALCTLGSASADSAGGPPATRASGAKGTMKTAPMKANGSGVVVRFRVADASPQAGKAVSVELTFEGITDPSGAMLRLVGDGGVSLGATEVTRTLPAGAATTLTVEVTPAAEGVGYLNVFTTQYGATSATSIPLQVGKAAAALPASGDVKQMPGGEKILPMPVK